MSATPEREQAEAQELARSVIDANGPYDRSDEGKLSHAVLALAAAVSRLEAERDEDAKNFEATCRLWRDAEEALKVARSAVDELTEQVIAAEGRERELARALAFYADGKHFRREIQYLYVLEQGDIAREALAGGGRTPDGPMGVTTSGAEKANILNLPVPVRYRSGTGPDGLDSRGGGAAVAEAGPPVVPCRGVLRFTFASTEDNAFDDAVFDMLIAALDSVGAFFECGSAEQMVPADVIPESPLAGALTTATVSPPESVSPGAADVAEAGE